MTKQQTFSDDTPMPWGTHEGTTLKELPASYLLWLFEQAWIASWPGLHAYLKEHEDQLMQERAEQDDTRLAEDGGDSYADYESYRGS